MTNIAEQIQKRLLLSDKVVVSARAQTEFIAQALAERAQVVEGPETANTRAVFEGMIRFLANELEHAAEAMRQAEQVVAAEQADDLAIRAARDAAATELAMLLARLRAAIDEHLGNEALELYGIEADTPRAPRKLVEYVRNVVELLERNPAKVTSPFGSSLDTAAVVAVLSPRAEKLEKLVVEDDREWRELEDAYARRNRAIEVWTDTYQGTASALEGLYRCAGYGHLAARVRPTLRRIRGEDAGPEEG